MKGVPAFGGLEWEGGKVDGGKVDGGKVEHPGNS